ncbi:hypothetical protein GOBAR_AA29433 [Gossypium barbadense]|uniref:Uncharacterized protein n=1 Tax=Gossypium barbadense TaxID=3634 RepID=A0A2P5WJI4_GOSBA|nr:hypothetical protein GOBAR_AA29433 [Gossypium barbadense]
MAPHSGMAHAADGVRGYRTTGAKGAGGSSCKRGGTGTILSLLGTEHATRDSLRRFVYPGMDRRIIAGIDRRSTTGNLTGGGGHRHPGMRWAWAVPWITPGCSMSLPP